jgi:hypothetical protein
MDPYEVLPALRAVVFNSSCIYAVLIAETDGLTQDDPSPPPRWQDVLGRSPSSRNQNSSGREHCLLYVRKFEGNVCVLHVFEQKTGKTGKADL